MFNVRFFVGVILGLFLFVSSLAHSGSLDAPAGPTDPASAMFTIEDIFNRLGSSTTVTKRTGSFTEPSAVPASTGHTLDEVMTLVDSRARAPKSGAGDISGYTENANEDSTLQKGVTWPNPRFTDNGDGTVTDNLTTLIWLDNANCADAERTWANALTDVASLNSAGTMNSNSCGDTSNGGTFQTDWRLPNIMELYSLIHYGFNDPALPNTVGTAKWSANDPFANVASDYLLSFYWSSTTVGSSTTHAWAAVMGAAS